MSWRCASALGVLLLLGAGCGGHGATQFSGAASAPQHFQFKCSICHDPGVNPGSEQAGLNALPTCNTATCHPSQVTHHPGTQHQCLMCHHPHLSSNLILIREEILTPHGTSRAVEFTKLAGLAPGGLADGAGNGLCEICHTTTEFYRSDASGATHFSFACYTCHSHAVGFAPPP